MSDRFCHLRVHTEYSLVDGVVRIPALVDHCCRTGMPAVAVTDQCNLFAMVKFYTAAEAAGVKPLIGVDLWVQDEPADVAAPSRLVLLCQDEHGYRNLTRLVTRSYLEGQARGMATIRPEWLDELSPGLIALSGGPGGDVGRRLTAGDQAAARACLERWLCRFPDRFYLELHRTGRTGEDVYIDGAVDLAAALGVPVVATNDVRFLRRDEFEAHEARVCIQNGRTLTDPRRPRWYSDEQYMRTPAEMAALFADMPEALDNTVEIARRCNLDLKLGQNVLPAFPVPRGLTADDYFRRQAREGLDRYLAGGQLAAEPEVYRQRLERELDVICQMGFAGYFLIVADFIHWAKSNGVPVGPGRGSGAGSLVAYALGITGLDPLRYDLLFERFLNPERVSMPDFDIDFCMEGRDRVIDYVAERYGRDRVSQIITYGSMAARAVVRDVGRVLGHPYGFVDRIAKLIPNELGMTLERALEQEPDLRQEYDREEEVRTLIDLGRALEGLARNAGTHAGGVVIAPAALTEYTPLYRDQGSDAIVTQFDKDDVEQVGLVKFDFLGLRTLTIIDRAMQTVNAQRVTAGEPALDIEAIPLEDEATFNMLRSCRTTAVFQLESRGMKDLIKRLQPDRFEDVVALVALFRPGPLQSGMVDDFIARKHGARVDYPHSWLEPVLKPTYGVILYQEQVMQIAQVMAGYTLGGADLLRRAMGKKKAGEMATQREVFMAGARDNGIAESTARRVFDLMEKFAGYGFNKSHSAAYALVAYQTAWLKAHFPAAFMAAVLSADMDHTDKVVTLIQECRDMGLGVLPPGVNESSLSFTVHGDAAIRYGLGAIKGVGRSAIDALIAERDTHGPYTDLFELCRRIDLRRCNRRVLEALIRAGALDGLGANRATLSTQLPAALHLAEQHVRNDAAGQDDLFGLSREAVAPSPAATPAHAEAVCDEWDEEARLAAEKESLGLYLTGHPIDRYRNDLAAIVTASLGELTTPATADHGQVSDMAAGAESTAVVAGLVVGLRTASTQRGGRMAFLTLDDRSARLDVRVFPEDFQRWRSQISKDRLLVVEGGLALDDYTGAYRMTARSLYDLDEALAAFAQRVTISVDAATAAHNGFIDALAGALAPFRDGACPVVIDYRNNGASARLALGERWQVQPAWELITRLRAVAGEDRVTVDYRRPST